MPRHAANPRAMGLCQQPATLVAAAGGASTLITIALPSRAMKRAVGGAAGWKRRSAVIGGWIIALIWFAASAYGHTAGGGSAARDCADNAVSCQQQRAQTTARAPCTADYSAPPPVIGEISQGSLAVFRAPPRASVAVNQRGVRVSPDGLFVVGFGREANTPTSVQVAVSGCPLRTWQLAPKARQFSVQKIEGVAPQYVSPPQDAIARIRRDSARVRAARNTDSEQQDFLHGFSWPATGIITGVFGSSRHYNGVPSRPHYGIDIAAPQGAPVYAPAAGVVRLAQDLYFSGNTIVIDHGHGVSSTLLHLSRMHVSAGKPVTRCQQIGEVGSTGRSTGAHLDWRINWFATRLDPATVAISPQPSACALTPSK